MSAEDPTVVIVGAGILGLASAIQLQNALGRSTTILIVARDWPYDESIHYTSPWAGAQGRPMPAVTASDIRYRTFAGVTNAVLRAQAAKYPACSVEFKDGYEFRASPSEAYVNLSGGYGKADGFRLLASHEFPKDMGITFGAKYRTWGLNPPVYCAHLLRRFQLKGGKTLKRTLVCAEEAFSLARNVETVVNCSGFGFGDPNVFPIRGQTCLVSNPCDRHIMQENADGTWTFIIPRPMGGGTIIGGTKEPNDWAARPRPDTRERILQMAAKMYPPILNSKGKFDVIRDIVGRRPARKGGLRLEIEAMKGDLRGKRIIHAYGAEGTGYAISWGVADEVVKLALEKDHIKLRPTL